MPPANLPDRLLQLDAPTIRGRPLVVRPNVGAWIPLLFALVIGIQSYRRNFNPTWYPPDISTGPDIGANFRTYRYAAELAIEGEPFYEVVPPALDSWAVFLYPPITTIAFLPFTLLDWWTGYRLLVLMNVIAGLLAAWLVVRSIEERGHTIGWTDVTLIGLVFLLSPFSWGTIYYGNINLILALAFVWGFRSLRDGRETRAGVLFGLTALWKVFPAVIGAWFLRTRAWRAVAAACGIGLGGLALGLVLGWRRTWEFFTVVLLDRSETAAFVGGFPPGGTYYVTIQRPISQLLWTLWPGAPAALLTVLTLLVVGLVLLSFYREIDDEMERLFAILATVIVAITIVPALQWYLVLVFFPMIPLLYRWQGAGRWVFVAGATVLFFNDSPGTLLNWLEEQSFPTIVELALTDVLTLASIQLYGLAIMLLGCWWYRRRRRSPDAGWLPGLSPTDPGERRD